MSDSNELTTAINIIAKLIENNQGDIATKLTVIKKSLEEILPSLQQHDDGITKDYIDGAARAIPSYTAVQRDNPDLRQDRR